MKLYCVLPLCLLSGFASAAGIYEVDRSQWETKPAAAATKPKPHASAAAAGTGTQAATRPAPPVTDKAQPTTAADAPPRTTAPQTSTGQDMAQTCQPGHPCNDLQ